MQHLYILTGASRGLGAAMADQLLSPAHRLLCISRSASAGLLQRAGDRGADCQTWSLDLSDPGTASARLQAWLQAEDPNRLSGATLINNAATVSGTGPIDGAEDAELSAALRVSLEAPLLLCAAFLRATRGWQLPKRVLNISSGLGRRAMAAQAIYCAAKAGLDHGTRALALDEALQPHGARVVSLAPGVIDTDMQEQLRTSTAAGFPDRAQFIAMKTGGQLASAAQAAAKVLAYLERPDFGAHPVADIRDA